MSSSQPPFWRDALAPFAQPHLGRSVLDLAASVVPYLLLLVLMYLPVDSSFLLVLALSVPAAGFLLRTFIVFHDCAHGSFLPSKRANAWLGTALGLLVYESFVSWRHSHAVHHATAGDLDRRGVGDVHTLTVAEYRSLAWRGRLGYRLFGRNMIPVDQIDIRAPRDSDAWHLALMGRQFPGSFLPYGEEQIVRTADPHFRLVSSSSGRLDYIETIRQWRQRLAAPSFRKTLLKYSCSLAG